MFHLSSYSFALSELEGEREVIVRKYLGKKGHRDLKDVFFSSQKKENIWKTRPKHANEGHPGRVFLIPMSHHSCPSHTLLSV